MSRIETAFQEMCQTLEQDKYKCPFWTGYIPEKKEMGEPKFKKEEILEW